MMDDSYEIVLNTFHTRLTSRTQIICTYYNSMDPQRDLPYNASLVRL